MKKVEKEVGEKHARHGVSEKEASGKHVHQREKHAGQESAITVHNLTKTFKTPKTLPGVSGFMRNLVAREYTQKTAVDSISFEIGAGELVGFLGPNGAGKTTTMKMLSGVLYPTSGAVDVLGYVPFEKKPAFLRQIAFIMGQRSQLMWELPAMDTFRLNKAIYGVTDADFRKTVGVLADLLDAQSLLLQPAKTLSLGQRMKMELIAALLHRPKVLFLDEPTIGLDVVAQKIVRDFIKNYQREFGATILLTSHYMEDIRRLAERVIVISDGRLIYNGQLEIMVRKFATKKAIDVIVEDIPKTSDLAKVGMFPEMDFPHIRYHVPRKRVPELVQKISRHLVFVDMNVEEERVEDIVRGMFGRAHGVRPRQGSTFTNSA